MSLAVVLLVLGVASAIYLWSTGTEQGHPAGPTSRLSVRACPYVDTFAAELRCYWYKTTDGFRLPVAVMRAGGDARAKEALVYLPGGPGQSGNTSAPMLSYWATWRAEAGLKQDLILFDYRGLAPGGPSWDCPEYTEISRAMLTRSVSQEQENEAVAPVLQDCLKRFAKALGRSLPEADTSPLGPLTTRANAGDAEAIVEALGYQAWNALGVSYGTRVALVAALESPRLRRLILDSPYPLAAGGASQAAALWPLVFERFWRACQAGELCSKPAVVGEEGFWRLLERLKRHPVSVKVKDWHRSVPVRWRLNDVRLLWLLNSAMYSRGSLVEIEPLLAELQSGGPIESNLPEQFYNQAFDPSFNAMVFFATECNDNRQDSEASHSAALDTLGPWREYFAGDSNSDVCGSAYFSGGDLPTMANLPQPVLVAGGRFDPVTPPEYIDGLMEYLPNGTLLENPGAAHAEFYGSRCGLQSIRLFLDLPESELNDLVDRLPEECRGWR